MKSDVNKTLFRIIKIASTVLILLIVVVGTFRTSMTAYDFGYRVFTEPAMADKPGTTVVVTIEKSMEAMDIADYLLEKGLIRDANLFWLQYQLSAYKGEILPGVYTLNTSMAPKELIMVMADAVEEDEDAEDSNDSDDTSTKSTETTESTEGTETE